jgi:hypothetical protein
MKRSHRLTTMKAFEGVRYSSKGLGLHPVGVLTCTHRTIQKAIGGVDLDDQKKPLKEHLASPGPRGLLSGINDPPRLKTTLRISLSVD